MTEAPSTAATAAPMRADIARQPGLLADLLARRDRLAAFARAHLRPDPGGRLVAYGCGDGWFAARAAAPAARAGGLAYAAVGALPFLLHEVETLGASDRVLAITMSGNVDRTVEAAEAARARGVPVALLTNGEGGRTGALGLPRFSLGVPDLAPFLCGTSSYALTLASLLLALAGERDEAAAALDGLVPVLPDAIAAADRETRRLARPFAGVRMLACGPGLASADYGCAKLVELTRIPTWSDDLEEFAHRQFWSADPGELIVLLPSSPREAGYASESARALAEMGFATLALESGAIAVPGAGTRLALPAALPLALPILQAVALQLLAYHLAGATGLDPNTRAHLKADATRFRTSRRLTRRALLGTGR